MFIVCVSNINVHKYGKRTVQATNKANINLMSYGILVNYFNSEIWR